LDINCFGVGSFKKGTKFCILKGIRYLTRPLKLDVILFVLDHHESWHSFISMRSPTLPLYYSVVLAVVHMQPQKLGSRQARQTSTLLLYCKQSYHGLPNLLVNPFTITSAIYLVTLFIFLQAIAEILSVGTYVLCSRSRLYTVSL